MKKDVINLNKMYKLPWSKNDNPNGWLELTTFCQLNCKGCYRGLDKKNPKRFHTSLSKLKKEVEYFIKKRNVQTISLSGGEPLLYPHLEKLVRYIKSKNIRVKIYTNGILLTKEKIIELKKAGVDEFIIHIDKLQKRKGYYSEKSLNFLRENFCKIFKEVGDVNLGFIMTISNKNLSELEDVLTFFKENADVINLIVFTIYNPLVSNKDPTKIKKISIGKIVNEIKKVYNCDPSTYLPKKYNKKKVAWLFFYPLISDGKIIGSIKPEKYKTLQERYKKNKGKYFITIKRKEIKKKNYFYFFNFFKAIKILMKRKPVYNQVILIIDSPEITRKGWNLCEGCPDAAIFEKKVVPSCLLERIKRGERIKL